MSNEQPALCLYPPCLHPVVEHDVYPHGERRRCLHTDCDCRYPWLNANPPVVYISPEFSKHVATIR